MSGRKAGAMGLVERLAAALAVNEIVRSRRFLGEHTSKEDREELLKLTASELTSTAQVLASAVHLRQQVETAEFTRALKIAIELDKFLRRLEAEGRKQYTIGELFDEVLFPVWKL